jgi:hypothetical protein
VTDLWLLSNFIVLAKIIFIVIIAPPISEDIMKNPQAKMQRLCVEVPVALHTAMKVECARRRLKMTDVLRALIEHEFSEPKARRGKNAPAERAEA